MDWKKRSQTGVVALLLITFLALLLAGCGGTSSPPTATVSGAVVSSQTGAGIAGAVVRAGTKVAITGADGSFSLPGVVAGTRRIWITKNDFAPYLNTRSLPAGAVSLGTIALHPTPGTSFHALQVDGGSGGIILPDLIVSEQLAVVVASRNIGDSAVNCTTPVQATAALAHSALPLHRARGTSLRLLPAPPWGDRNSYNRFRRIEQDLVRRRPVREMRGLSFRTPRFLEVGVSEEDFWVLTSDEEQLGNEDWDRRRATLKYASVNTYVFLDNGKIDAITQAGIDELGTAFSTSIHPTTRDHFGSEDNPGIDNDPHIYILLTDLPGGLAGYFWAVNEYSESEVRDYGAALSPPQVYHSNEKQIFFVDPDMPVQELKGVLAHEFQHMIFFHERSIREDPEMPIWLNEGLSEMSMEVNGFGLSAGSLLLAGHVHHYAMDTSLQSLTQWEEVEQLDYTGDYGVVYLFLRYLTDRFGRDKLKAIVQGSASGKQGVAAAAGMPFDDLFTDWTLAMLLDHSGWVPDSDPGLAKRFNYADDFFHRTYGVIDLDGPWVWPSMPPGGDGKFRTRQYGVDYAVVGGYSGSVTWNFQVDNGAATDVIVIRH